MHCETYNYFYNYIYTCETYNYFLMRLVPLEKYQHIYIQRGDPYAVVKKRPPKIKNTDTDQWNV